MTLIIDLFQIFDNFRKENPQVLRKVKAIAGDVGEPRLGLTAEDEQQLIDSVHVIFHVAAIVKFDATLKDAINMNVEGTLRLLELATKMRKLEVIFDDGEVGVRDFSPNVLLIVGIQAFIHTSTAYCHCDIMELDEKPYEAEENPRDVMNMVRWMKPDLLDFISHRYVLLAQFAVSAKTFKIPPPNR